MKVNPPKKRHFGAQTDPKLLATSYGARFIFVVDTSQQPLQVQDGAELEDVHEQLLLQVQIHVGLEELLV